MRCTQSVCSGQEGIINRLKCCQTCSRLQSSTRSRNQLTTGQGLTNTPAPPTRPAPTQGRVDPAAQKAAANGLGVPVTPTRNIYNSVSTKGNLGGRMYSQNSGLGNNAIIPVYSSKVKPGVPNKPVFYIQGRQGMQSLLALLRPTLQSRGLTTLPRPMTNTQASFRSKGRGVSFNNVLNNSYSNSARRTQSARCNAFTYRFCRMNPSLG